MNTDSFELVILEYILHNYYFLIPSNIISDLLNMKQVSKLIDFYL